MNPSLLDAVGQAGVLASVSMKFWRAAKKLEPADLGLTDGQIAERLICLGHKRLLPRDALARFALLESRAHAAVERASFPFLGGIARFVPNERLANLTSVLEDIRDEFRAEIETFMARYEDLRDTSLDEWREAAFGLNLPPDELVDRIASNFPTGLQVRQKFHFDAHFYQVAAPQSLGLIAIDAMDQQAIAQSRDRIAREAAQKLAEDTESFVSDCVATLREQTAQICQEMLSSMQTGKTEGVHQKTLNRLVKFIDEFKTLNFAEDSELEGMLEDARRALLSKTAEEYRDNTKAQAQLTNGLRKLGEEARRLAGQEAREIVERFGQLGARRFSLAA